MAEEAFEYYAFLEALTELTHHLIELKYVDDAYDFLRSDAQNQPAPSVVHELGYTYPFSIASSPIPDGTSDDPDDYPYPGGLTESEEKTRLSELSHAAATWGYGVRAGVQFDCKPVTKPVVDDYDRVAESLRDLAQTLKDDNAVALGRAGFGLDGSKWEGNSASSFFRGFVQPFTVVNENHQIALAQTAACVGAGRVVVLACQNALMNIVVTLRDAVKDQLKQRQEQNRHAIISAETLTVISTGMSIVGTLAGATGAGAGVGVALGVASTGLGYAATKIPAEDSETAELEVAEAETVSEKLTTQIESVLKVYRSDWSKIGNDADRVARNVERDESDGLLYPPAPRLNGVSPNDFHHESSAQY